jgi:TolB protein
MLIRPTRRGVLGTLAALPLALSVPAMARAQTPLRITVTDPTIEPLPFAIPSFEVETGGAEGVAGDITRLVAQDLVNSGIFREIPSSAFISGHPSFAAAPTYADWRAINAQALVTGAVAESGGNLNVKFRLYDVFSGAELGEGLQFAGTTGSWRRVAHKVADAVYSRITGEGGYFDSRVVYVAEQGPKDARLKRLAVMDYDGAGVQYLTDSAQLLFAPRVSADGRRVLYTSYESGFPRIYLLDMASVSRSEVPTEAGEMAFSPRFTNDGQSVVYSLINGGNTDIWRTGLGGGSTRLTSAPSIETAPSFSPDGSQIVFESDRSGGQQLYVMGAGGGEPARISFGEGRYGTPVWSPRGDLIAFTKQNAGRFHIGVMRTDGSEERLLTASFLDEGPTWAPNGRVLMFTRESQGAEGAPSVWSVDVSGRTLRQVPTEGMASDPSWGPLQA